MANTCVYILEMEADAVAASLRSRLDAAEFPRRVAAAFNYGKPSLPRQQRRHIASEVAFLRSDDDSAAKSNSSIF